MKMMMMGLVVVTVSADVLTQAPADAEIASLIKKLSSSNARFRIEATEALKKRPEAAVDLRNALRSSDLETARRASEILKYLDNRDLRELENVVNGAPFNRVLEAITNWPTGKDEEELWFVVRGAAKKMVDRHEKLDGEKIKNQLFWSPRKPFFKTAKRIDDSVEGKIDTCHFLRAQVVDLDLRRPFEGLIRNNWFYDHSFIVSSGPVKIYQADAPIIFAGGVVELEVTHLHGAVIISDSDIKIKGDVAASLLIARGSISCTGTVDGCRLISGKSVTTKREPIDCQISENDANPLGIIRWDDSPIPKKKQSSK